MCQTRDNAGPEETPSAIFTAMRNLTQNVQGAN